MSGNALTWIISSYIGGLVAVAMFMFIWLGSRSKVTIIVVALWPLLLLWEIWYIIFEFANDVEA